MMRYLLCLFAVLWVASGSPSDESPKFEISENPDITIANGQNRNQPTWSIPKAIAPVAYNVACSDIDAVKTLTEIISPIQLENACRRSYMSDWIVKIPFDFHHQQKLPDVASSFSIAQNAPDDCHRFYRGISHQPATEQGVLECATPLQEIRVKCPKSGGNATTECGNWSLKICPPGQSGQGCVGAVFTPAYLDRGPGDA